MFLVNRKKSSHFLIRIFSPLVSGNFFPLYLIDSKENRDKNNMFFALGFNGQSRKYSNKSTKNKLITPPKIDKYLGEIRKILGSHIGTPEAAQRIIEEKWLEIGHDGFDMSSELYKRNTTIIGKAADFLARLYAKRVLKKTTKFLHDYISDEKYVLAAYSIILSYHNKTAETNLNISIGRNIVYQIYKDYFKFEDEFKVKERLEGVKNVWKKKVLSEDSHKTFSNFSDFMEYFKIDIDYYLKLGNIFLELFTHIIENPVFVRLYYDGQYVIRINEEYESEILENFIVSPQTLPMVCKPGNWSESEYGGFLLNSEPDFQEGLVTGSSNHSHTIELNKGIYAVVNHLNGLRFRINNTLLRYLENDGAFLLEYYKEKDNEVFINNSISLNIAKVYKDTAFYLNTSLDWRGRIYTKSFYIDYQGSEFSLALINQDKGAILTDEGKFYLYIYGANCYNENNTAKKTFEERYSWVIENLEKIYLMEKEFILKAESPTLFAAFCLAMRELKSNPNYIHYSPVFLDATCSGVQHFAAMLLDKDLAEQVNLISGEDEDQKVKDFYNTLVPHINKAINEAWKEDGSIPEFADIELTRKHLKRIIMTKSYNVTTYGISGQLKSSLEKIKKTIIIDEEERVVYDYKVPANNEDGMVALDIFKIDKLAGIINDNIFNHYSSLQSIYNYLTQMAKVLISQGIPLVWSTPTGLVLTQRYNLSKIKKVTINLLGKNRTAVLRRWLEDIDTRKQAQGIIPNIIHSMDATHLGMVVEEWSLKKNNEYILPIHDCFGTHPNDMGELSTVVRNQFIMLYSDKSFLQNLHNNFIKSLHDYQVDIYAGDNEEYVIGKKKKKIVIPKLPKLGNLDIKHLNGRYNIS